VTTIKSLVTCQPTLVQLEIYQRADIYCVKGRFYGGALTDDQILALTHRVVGKNQ
jgi:hypothetical protein